MSGEGEAKNKRYPMEQANATISVAHVKKNQTPRSEGERGLGGSLARLQSPAKALRIRLPVTNPYQISRKVCKPSIRPPQN
jgi:hypothetical protein